MNDRGATIIEILVASVIFALAATGAAQALAVAQRARRTSELAMRAGEIAVEGLERLRAGDRGANDESIGAFERRWASRIVDPLLGLERLDVVVSWQDGGERSLMFSSLVRSP
jgi:prepilin-type N-terminal cleavage/methylation domain-containing protein